MAYIVTGPCVQKRQPINYRGIALMSTCAKLYNRLLLGRIRDGLDSHLRPNQNGFRPLRSAGQYVLAWRRIHEEVIATKFASLYSTFIDFSKAFKSLAGTTGFFDTPLISLGPWVCISLPTPPSLQRIISSQSHPFFIVGD